jgi:restriction system protein
MIYQTTISHTGLNKVRRITGNDKWLVEEKARTQNAAWDAQWADRCRREQQAQERVKSALVRDAKKRDAIERTAEAEEDLTARTKILVDRSGKQNVWSRLKNDAPFPTPKPSTPPVPSIPPAPNSGDAIYQPKIDFIDRLIPSLRRRKIEAADKRLCIDRDNWTHKKSLLENEYQRSLTEYQTALAHWNQGEKDYLHAQTQQNAAVDELKRRYSEKESDAIEEYNDVILAASEYPDWCPKGHSLSYVHDSAILAVDYRLPAVADLPTLKQVRYIVTKDTTEEIHLKQNEINNRYDEVVYQICLRTIHELFVNNPADATSAVIFNGWVEFVDPANGKQARSCIISAHASREQFIDINLDQVDPKACFKALKGVGSSKLYGMSAIAPLLRINRDDPRFIASVDIEGDINEGTNLAAIGWEDFEFLIREIFEREFSKNGGEVKVTRASRDGGVDAVAFDPDPIRGGKIVIQAKRYTNTVGVSAVRDLYGTVMNEGATKGILVTTSSYGPDAYTFAKDKPLTLMDGGNLLYLLQQHGHKAYINLNEAKQVNLQPLARTLKASPGGEK